MSFSAFHFIVHWAQELCASRLQTSDGIQGDFIIIIILIFFVRGNDTPIICARSAACGKLMMMILKLLENTLVVPLRLLLWKKWNVKASCMVSLAWDDIYITVFLFVMSRLCKVFILFRIFSRRKECDTFSIFLKWKTTRIQNNFCLYVHKGAKPFIVFTMPQKLFPVCFAVLRIRRQIDGLFQQRKVSWAGPAKCSDFTFRIFKFISHL